MTYATRDDLNAAFGQDQVDRLAARPENEDGSEAVARALSYAEGVISGRLAVRFILPLSETPPLVRDIAVDLAIARLASDATSLTDDIRLREKTARSDLDRIADGKMNLGLPSGDAGSETGDRPQPIVSSTGGKLFTRDRLRGL